MPEPGEDETVRVVALDRSFHVECYKCEVKFMPYDSCHIVYLQFRHVLIFVVVVVGLRYAFIKRSRRSRLLST